MSEQTFEEKYPAIAAELAGHAELVRVDRWHATYNAALTGFTGSGAGWTAEAYHEEASHQATVAHGPLVKP